MSAMKSPLIETIPNPEPVRLRLTEIYREAAILRRLLRLAEQKNKASSNDAEVAPEPPTNGVPIDDDE